MACPVVAVETHLDRECKDLALEGLLDLRILEAYYLVDPFEEEQDCHPVAKDTSMELRL